MRLFKDDLVMYFFPHLETQEGNFCAEDFRKLAELLWAEKIANFFFPFGLVNLIFENVNLTYS